MEHVKIVLGNDEKFDKAIRGEGVLLQASDIKIITKDKGTTGGKGIAVITFDVEVDGKIMHAQAVTTVNLLKGIAASLNGRYDDNGRSCV